MIVNLVQNHGFTKGAEKHPRFIFTLQSETAGVGHGPSIFEFQGEKYRSIHNHAKAKPVVKDGKKFPVSCVVAVKCSDEAAWQAKGREGKICPEEFDKINEQRKTIGLAPLPAQG